MATWEPDIEQVSSKLFYPFKGNSLKERVYWVDYAKTISVTLVILAHIHLKNKFYTDFIYSFNMPLSFMASGFLFNRGRRFVDDVKKSFRTLIIPYISFYILIYFAWLEGFIKHPEIFPDRGFYGFMVKPFVGLIFGVGYNTPYSYMVDIPLWFFMALFCGKVIFSGLWRISKGRNGIISILLLLLIAALFLVKSFNVVPIFSLGSGIMALPFFYIGFLMKKSGADFTALKKYVLWLAIIVGFIITTFVTIINGSVDVNYVNFGKNVFLFYMMGTSGSLMAIALSILLDNFIKWDLITFISNNTRTIFALHLTILIVTLEVLGRFIKSEAYNELHSLSYSILIAIIVLIICMVPSLLVEKYFPFMLGKKKKVVSVLAG